MTILAIDQGTTGTTTVVINGSGQVVVKAYQEFTQHYPQPGWVEHDPNQIWDTVVDTINRALDQSPGQSPEQSPEPIKAIGITNQRETTILWNRKTGEPIYAAIVWQCRRTAQLCEQYRTSAEMIKRKTGLPLDAYFSATKIKWLIDHLQLRPDDDICFGTIDSWLIWKLTGGQVHATDITNASRTLLFNIDTRQWDEELCALFGVPMSWLPKVLPSIGSFGVVSAVDRISGVTIAAVAGDQQSSLFGQKCWFAGQTKNTYGTGAFMVMNTGGKRIDSAHGLITTLAVGPDGQACYALEGSVFVAGAAIQWLRDELRVLEHAADSEAIALSVPDSAGVYFVPAFVGLGAPYWDMDVRGGIVGLTRGSGRAHIVRAALEAMAYQSLDVLNAMQEDAGEPITALAVDGGATANNFLMQFQADIMGRPILRPKNIESTSLGVALMALRFLGVNVTEESGEGRTFSPQMELDTRTNLIAGWRHAVSQIRS